MTKAATPHRWFSGWRQAQPAADTDAADLGTAFGLDLSLNQIYQEPQPAAPAVSRQPAWVQRLSARHKRSP